MAAHGSAETMLVKLSKSVAIDMLMSEKTRLQVYAGAVSALALMTVLSAVMGWAAPNLVCPHSSRMVAL